MKLHHRRWYPLPSLSENLRALKIVHDKDHAEASNILIPHTHSPLGVIPK
jgi:hypothetical protein